MQEPLIKASRERAGPLQSTGPWYFALALILIFGASLWPAGLYNDDAVTSNWRSDARLQDQSIIGFSWTQFKLIVAHQGRFTPVYSLTITPLLLAIEENLAIYRVWHFCWTVAALACLAIFVKTLTRVWMCGFIAPLGTIVVAYVTTYHNSLVSYGVVLQQTTAFGFIGLTFIARAFETERSRNARIFTAVAFLSLGVLTSEFGMVFMGAAPLMLMHFTRWRHALRLSLPFVFAGVIYALITISVKGPGQYEGTTFGQISILPIIRTWFYQISGTIPFAYHQSPAGQAVHGPGWLLQHISSPGFVFIFLFATAGFLGLLRALTVVETKTICLLAVIGAWLILTPATLTAISDKYQRELVYGVSYLQLFIQFNGLGLILTAGALILSRSRPTYPWIMPIARGVFAVALAFTFSLNGQLNRQSIEYQNTVWKFPREHLAEVLRHLECDSGRRAVFVVARRWLHRWETRAFAYKHFGVPADFISWNDESALQAALKNPEVCVHLISYPTRGGPFGSAFMAQVRTLRSDSGDVPQLEFIQGTQRLLIFAPDSDMASQSYAQDSAVFTAYDSAPLAFTDHRVSHDRFTRVYHSNVASIQISTD